MYCRYCGQFLEDDSVYCSFCGKQLQTVSKIEDEMHIDSRVVNGAVFSNIICENDRNGCIELYPATCNFKCVTSGYTEHGFCHVYMKDISRSGSGFESIFNYNQKPASDYTWIYAHLSDGKETFCAELNKTGKALELFSIEYRKRINDKCYHTIECSRWLNKEKHKFLGITIAEDSYPDWSAQHYPTETYNQARGLNYAYEIINIEDWMKKYGHYYFADVQKYYDDLEEFIGMSPYVFFEYDKYK